MAIGQSRFDGVPQYSGHVTACASSMKRLRPCLVMVQLKDVIWTCIVSPPCVGDNVSCPVKRKDCDAAGIMVVLPSHFEVNWANEIGRHVNTDGHRTGAESSTTVYATMVGAPQIVQYSEIQYEHARISTLKLCVLVNVHTRISRCLEMSFISGRC